MLMARGLFSFFGIRLMTPSAFGLRLKALRTAAGLSQFALAAKAGITETAVNYIEVGRREPSWSTAVRLAAALGVGVEAFAEPPLPGVARAAGRAPSFGHAVTEQRPGPVGKKPGGGGAKGTRKTRA
jgi:DNA-binding XRE family transcriptional regulator